MPYGQLVDDSQCNMVCSGDSTEFCGAGSRLALYQDNSATPPNPSTCITGRDSFSFGNSGIQFIPRQGSTNTVNGTGPQMFATTLDPSTDGSLQHTVITNCKTCPYSSNEAPLYNFELYQNILSPYGIFGTPIPIAPQAGEPLTFLGFSTSTAYAQFCAKPNPVSPEGLFIGFPLLSVGGYTDRFSICPNTTANGILTVIYSPIANHADYTLSSCQDAYMLLTPFYTITD
ncbi:hypothetical protein BDQ17DRAFT_1368424 [Cyathus striatus]|nr:hypothetical protein BDQ17DRAFT_1368424 [Cyathus striatus]